VISYLIFKLQFEELRRRKRLRNLRNPLPKKRRMKRRRKKKKRLQLRCSRSSRRRP